MTLPDLQELTRLYWCEGKPLWYVYVSVFDAKKLLDECKRLTAELARYRKALLCPRCKGTGEVPALWRKGSILAKQSCTHCEAAAIRRENAK